MIEEKKCEYKPCSKMYYGTKRAKYCCKKCNTYQNRKAKKDIKND